MLRFAPDKRLYFDPANGVAQLIDEYAELLAKEPESKLVQLSRADTKPVISQVPFSHLLGSYQASLRDADKTLDVIARTEHTEIVGKQAEVIKNELNYISNWLDKWAPQEVKFELKKDLNLSEFSNSEKNFLKTLGQKIAAAPTDADGEWFHKAIYDLQSELAMEPKEMFETLYKALIGKTSGPRAGWFLSILPREWLIKRLKLTTGLD